LRIVVIGGTGHIGSYLVPRLVEAGHHVIVMARGTREPYHPHPAWERVDRITIDKEERKHLGPSPDDVADGTRSHLLHSPHCSCDKAPRLIDYTPRYNVYETLCRGAGLDERRGDLA